MVNKHQPAWQLRTVERPDRAPGISNNRTFTPEDLERLRRFFALVRTILNRLRSEGYVIKDGQIISSPYDDEHRAKHHQSDRKRRLP